MTSTDRRTAPFLLFISAASASWGWWVGRPYWSLLSTLAVIWAAWAVWSRAEVGSPSWLMASISLAAAPLFGTLAGPASWPSLEDVLAPVLLYAMALDIVSESLAPVEACRPSAMLFLTALGTISAGSLVILSLYYVDALFSLNLLQTNSDLMWPLSTLFLGTIVITLVVRATGLEEHIWARKEVSG